MWDNWNIRYRFKCRVDFRTIIFISESNSIHPRHNAEYQTVQLIENLKCTKARKNFKKKPTNRKFPDLSGETGFSSKLHGFYKQNKILRNRETRLREFFDSCLLPLPSNARTGFFVTKGIKKNTRALRTVLYFIDFDNNYNIIRPRRRT